MNKIGIQTKNIVKDSNPEEGFKLLKESGFEYADFSLNNYLTNSDLYNLKINNFFDKTDSETEEFFMPYKSAMEKENVQINQMHMPYPLFLKNGSDEINAYLRNIVAQKSLKICKFFNCKYIVVHGFKLAKFLGSEEAEWKETDKFLKFIGVLAEELGIIICLENIYISVGNHIIEGPCCDADKTIERIDKLNDEFGREVFGFCFDTGHANLIGLDFEKFITALDFRLKVLHIHDNDGIADLHRIPFLFTKTRENNCSTDWKGFIQGLKNIKFDKVLSFETAPTLQSFPEELKSEVLRFIANVGNYFAKEISK